MVNSGNVGEETKTFVLANNVSWDDFELSLKFQKWPELGPDVFYQVHESGAGILKNTSKAVHHLLADYGNDI